MKGLDVQQYFVRGVRGAITIEQNDPQCIIDGTAKLLETMFTSNKVNQEDVCSIFFSTTPDLNQEFPAKAARKIGLNHIPLLCMTEIPVQGALEKCVRILIHWNTTKTQNQIIHTYLEKAKKLRPDLSNDPQ